MSLAYFPMYPSDFDADTGHLSFAEDGAYNRLLRLSWRCPAAKMPDDMDWICRKAKAATDADKALIAAIIAEFFTRKGGKIFSPRLQKEWVKSSDAHARRISAGSAGGKAKALKTNKTVPSNAVAMPKQPEPEPEPDKEEEKEPPLVPPAEIDAPEPKARLPANWALSDEGWAYARSQKIPDEVIEDEARGFHAYWADRRDRDAKKSRRGWEQCWAGWCRRIAPRYQRSGGMAFKAGPGGHGQGGSIASIAARRRATGAV
jgi:uncharacterized protein YdaU (DUF1376 family)